MSEPANGNGNVLLKRWLPTVLAALSVAALCAALGVWRNQGVFASEQAGIKATIVADKATAKDALDSRWATVTRRLAGIEDKLDLLAREQAVTQTQVQVALKLLDRIEKGNP